MRTSLAILLVLLALAAGASERPRLVVLTDIMNEPDDSMSLVRLLTYANELDIEALVATTSRHLQNTTRPDEIRRHIDLYGQVRANLLLHAPGYPTADALRALVTSGSTQYGMAGVGAGKDSAGSEQLIAVVDRADARPVYVSVWGGANTLAQALWKVRSTRSAAALAAFIGKIRTYTISDQDDSGAWIRTEFPDLTFIVSPGTNYGASTWCGISGDRHYGFTGPDFNLVSNAWVDQHVQHGHGPLGASYPDIPYIMEGDTPSWFYVLPFGPGDPAHPEWGGWGGRYENQGRGLWSDTTDRVLGVDGQWYVNNEATVWRWREAYQNDFQARMDWNVLPYAQANHPPRVAVAGALRRTVLAGQRVDLDASASTDPDGQALTWKWWLYAEPSRWTGGLAIDGATTARAAFTAPAVAGPTDLHLMLEVADTGAPRLIRYARIIVTVLPSGAPIVSAGPDLAVMLPAAATLDGSASDDGRPGPLTTRWTTISGPGSVAFANAAATDTTATFPAPGQYVLRLTASDGAETRFDEVVVQVSPAGSIAFAAGVNLHGGAVTIAGDRWWSHDQALAAGLQVIAPNRHISTLQPAPATDADTRAMLNSAIWSPGDLSVSLPLTAGDYDVRLWVMENHQTNYRSFAIDVEGQRRADTAGTLPLGGWATYGPYRTAVSDGRLDVALLRRNGDTHLMGLSVHRVGTQANAAPAVSAGPDLSCTLPAGAALDGTATDDGRPGPLTTRWTRVSGPGTVTFANPAAIDTTATFSAAGDQVLRLTASDGAETRFDEMTVRVLPAGVIGTGTGLSAQYFPNSGLTGSPAVTRVDATIDFDWGGGSPAAGIGADQFSARWTGRVQAMSTGTHVFTTTSDDGIRLRVGGQLLIDNWTTHAPTDNSGSIALVAGQTYDVVLDYFEGGGGAVARLSWATSTMARHIVPRSQLYPATVPPSSPDIRINLNGPAATIAGNAWRSHAEALSAGLSFPVAPRVVTTAFTPSPAVDAATAAMLNRAVYEGGDLRLAQRVPAGEYEVWLWVMENWAGHAGVRRFSVELEGAIVATDIGTMPLATWRRYGPYAAAVQDGALDLRLIRGVGEPHLMGLEILPAPALPTSTARRSGAHGDPAPRVFLHQ